MLPNKGMLLTEDIELDEGIELVTWALLNIGIQFGASMLSNEGMLSNKGVELVMGVLKSGSIEPRAGIVLMKACY